MLVRAFFRMTIDQNGFEADALGAVNVIFKAVADVHRVFGRNTGAAQGFLKNFRGRFGRAKNRGRENKIEIAVKIFPSKFYMPLVFHLILLRLFQYLRAQGLLLV